MMISQINNDQQGQWAALSNLSLVEIEAGDYTLAKKHLFQALDLARFSGDMFSQAVFYRNLGWNAQKVGDFQEAEYFFNRSLVLRRQIGDKRGEENVLDLIDKLSELRKATTELKSAVA